MIVNCEWIGIEKREDMESWADEQMGKLDKYLTKYNEDFRRAWLRISKENQFTTKVSLEINLPTGKEYFVEQGEDLRSVLDMLSEKAERWVKEHQDKLEKKRG